MNSTADESDVKSKEDYIHTDIVEGMEREEYRRNQKEKDSHIEAHGDRVRSKGFSCEDIIERADLALLRNDRISSKWRTVRKEKIRAYFQHSLYLSRGDW